MQSAAVKTWATNQMEEDAMNDDHLPLWLRMIDLLPDTLPLHDRNVLDFGCNQGGFLRTLYKIKPFKNGLGVDIATESIAKANFLSSGLPLSCDHVECLKTKDNSFDIAFSHEVLYLLPDLAEHARTIERVLKPGAIYFAAIGCHSDNPQWYRWKQIISKYSSVKVFDYSLNDYAEAFHNLNFDVSVRPFAFNDFIPLKANNEYFPSVKDSIDYYTTHKVLFSFRKKN